MLEKLTENASLLQAGLLGVISLLIGVIAFFVKKTYDKTDALDHKLITRHKDNLDLEQSFNNHKSFTSEAIITAKLEFTATMDKVRAIAYDIKDDVLKCMNAVEENQEEIKNNKKANELARSVLQNHQTRLKRSEGSIQKLENDLILVKGTRKSRQT